MTRDEVIAAITHAARAVVHANGSSASVATLDTALKAADAEGYGDAARAVAAAIVEELETAPAPAAPTPQKGVWVTVTVDWRLSKPPEKAPTWASSLDGKGKKALHSFHKSFYLKPEVYQATMETEAGIKKLEKLIYDRIEKEAKGEPAWIVFADVRLGRVGSDWQGEKQAQNLPSALHYNYWQNKVGLGSVSRPGYIGSSDDPTEPGFKPHGPAKGWWWKRANYGESFVYTSAKVE